MLITHSKNIIAFREKVELVYVTRFSKGVLYTHSFKTHFSSPSVNYINALTASTYV